MDRIIAAKIGQARNILREQGLAAWIVQFARETFDHPQPVQELLVGTTITWPAAFIVPVDGPATAIVGTGDVSVVQEVGAYPRVIGYVQDIVPVLRDVLAELDPDRIAVSYSMDDDGADNISHGMFLMLCEALAGTPYADRLTPADEVLVSLRARKLPAEIESIQGAVDATVELFTELQGWLRPGAQEDEIASRLQQALLMRGLNVAWDPRYDPIVSFGPGAVHGHGRPGPSRLEPGMLAHIDFGVKQDGYCSDLQRTYFLAGANDGSPPEDVQRAFTTLIASIDAGVRALRPGVTGWEVDAAARAVLVDSGYEDPEFAFGHQLGQSTHDGGCLLGPRWARYGTRPQLTVEESNVFTVEHALDTSRGMIGLEEDVVVTRDGAQYLTDPQRELIVIDS